MLVKRTLRSCVDVCAESLWAVTEAGRHGERLDRQAKTRPLGLSRLLMGILLDRQRTWLLLFGVSLVAICLVAGAAIARYPTTYILVPTAAGAGVAVVWWNRGVFSGIL